MVTIKLELPKVTHNHDIITTTERFDCRGREKYLCVGCRLRFKCLSERNEVFISQEMALEHGIKDLKGLAEYMFGEGRINYTMSKHDSYVATGKDVVKVDKSDKNYPENLE